LNTEGTEHLIDELISFLYDIIKKESEKVHVGKSTSREGFALEKTLELEIAEFCARKKATAITPYPARYELDAPTFSGQKHQFDLTVQYDHKYIVGECKRRQASTRDQILTFAAKLIDYGLGFNSRKYQSSIRGLFLSTAMMPEGSVMYALAMGVEPVSLNFAPIEYLVTTSRHDLSLRQKLLSLKMEITTTWPEILHLQTRDVRIILESYRNHCALWREVMKQHE
jgi:hypothetical protein